jgi:hypothetical protein
MNEITPKEQKPQDDGGIFENLATRVKLVIRLMLDGRVNPFLKLLPIGSLLYLLIPDAVIGPIDDVFIIWLGAYLFVELCPDEIVQEHLDRLNSTIEGTFKEVDDTNRIDKSD